MAIFRLTRIIVRNEDDRFAVVFRDFSVGKNLTFKGVVAQLPGGKVEEGQTFLEGAKTELREELGLSGDLSEVADIMFNIGEETIHAKYYVLEKSVKTNQVVLPPEEAYKFVDGKVHWFASVYSLAEICGREKYKIGYGIYDVMANL